MQQHVSVACRPGRRRARWRRCARRGARVAGRAVAASAAAAAAGGVDARSIDAVKAGDRDARARRCSRQRGRRQRARRPTARRRCTGPCAATTSRPRGCCCGAGANANAANRYGVTPLSLAAHQRQRRDDRRRCSRPAPTPNARAAGGRDGPDDRGAHRQSRRGAGCCSTRGADVERARAVARRDGADVGGGARTTPTPSRCSSTRGADVNARSNAADVPAGQVRLDGDRLDHGAAARRLDAADVRGAPGRARTRRARWPTRGADLER